jgi:hypothetical protein
MNVRKWPEDPAACKYYREAAKAAKPSTRNHQKEG